MENLYLTGELNSTYLLQVGAWTNGVFSEKFKNYISLNDGKGHTILMYACLSEKTEIVELLLDKLLKEYFKNFQNDGAEEEQYT